jgi:hypothetical protein
MKDKPQQLIEMSHLVDDAEKILTDKNTSLNEFGKLLGGKHMIIALLAHLVSHLKINVENSAKVC